MIYLLTAIGLSPDGSTHLHTNNTYNTNNNRTTQITTNVEKCGPCPVLASFTLAFALQLRKKHGKTSVRVRKTSEYSKYITKIPTNTHTHKHTHYKTHTYPHTHTHPHITKQYKTTTVQIQTVHTVHHYKWCTVCTVCTNPVVFLLCEAVSLF